MDLGLLARSLDDGLDGVVGVLLDVLVDDGVLDVPGVGPADPVVDGGLGRGAVCERLDAGGLARVVVSLVLCYSSLLVSAEGAHDLSRVR